MSRVQIVDAAWLDRKRAESNLVVLDARDRASYLSGHAFGALHLDASQLALSSTDPAAVDAFLARLGTVFTALGISPDSQVLIYGTQLDTNAARVAWALWFAGHNHVHVLNGQPAKLDDTRVPDAAAATVPFAIKARFNVFVGKDEIRANLTAPDWQIIDARDWEDYLGSKANAAASQRTGHIPGASHWRVAEENETQGRLRDAEQLAKRFADAGITPDKHIVVYCGSGGRASRSFLALTHAGYPRVSIYPASWKEWASLEALPIERNTVPQP